MVGCFDFHVGAVRQHDMTAIVSRVFDDGRIGMDVLVAAVRV